MNAPPPARNVLPAAAALAAAAAPPPAPRRPGLPPDEVEWSILRASVLRGASRPSRGSSRQRDGGGGAGGGEERTKQERRRRPSSESRKEKEQRRRRASSSSSSSRSPPSSRRTPKPSDGGGAAAAPSSTAARTANPFAAADRGAPPPPAPRRREGSPASPPPAGQAPPKSILRRRPSSSDLPSSSADVLRAQEREMKSIVRTLEDLQHDFVANDMSHAAVASHGSPGGASGTTHGRRSGRRKKEFAVRHFPNGDLFSGNVDAITKEPVYGRMTCAMEMETYEGPFRDGRRHGEGAVCVKVDGGAKFLGRYHEGQMHSGTLIVTRNLPSDFTYTGTFLDDDFHGIGTIVSQGGSIYQGQFARGQYHGLGTLRTACDEDDERGGAGDKLESVYTGDFFEGLFHGHGSLVYSDGSSFAGTWREGKRVEGTETSVDGEVFEGRFVDDLREGPGTLRTGRGGRIAVRGLWERDALKEGVDLEIAFAEGHVYCGDHVRSVPHGFGQMEYADVGSGKSAYTGWFVNGFRHGEGRCFFHKTGEEYEGDWACDEPIGLTLFQHSGPLVQVSSAELTASGEGREFLESLEYLSSSLHQLQDTLPKISAEGARPPSRRSSINDDLNSSLVSATSTGIVLLNAEETMTLSSADAKEKANTQRLRISTSDYSDNLSSSMKSLKSLTMLEYSEGLKLYRYQNGDLFKGHLDKANLRQGSGVYTEHRMGTVYNGDWRDSRRHGVGHLKLATGVEYSGEFFDDKIHGQGSLTLIDGSVYTGSFFNGLFHGRGMLEDEGKSRVYFGEFENGERSGEGEEKFSDGSRYKGGYKFGKRHGIGVLFDRDGSELYRGAWDENLQHGKGVLLRHQQAETSWEGSYEGDFFQGKFSGNGKYTYTDGTSIEGQWLDGIPRDGDWSIKYPDGSKFYGFATFQHPEDNSVASDKSSTRGRGSTDGNLLRIPLPHGFGSLTFPSGQRFVGSFVYGEYNDERRKK
ncbi:hypothetical protein ACHAWF_008087 [Thalassiosira exigua]